MRHGSALPRCWRYWPSPKRAAVACNPWAAATQDPDKQSAPERRRLQREQTHRQAAKQNRARRPAPWAVFPAFLGIQAHGGDRTRLEALQTDFLVGFFAETVAPVFDPLERLVDLSDQLAIAVARTQFQRVLGLPRRALGLVADVAHFIAQVLDGLLRLLDQILPPQQQLATEVLEVLGRHVFLVAAARTVAGRQVDLGHITGRQRQVRRADAHALARAAIERRATRRGAILGARTSRLCCSRSARCSFDLGFGCRHFV